MTWLFRLAARHPRLASHWWHARAVTGFKSANVVKGLPYVCYALNPILRGFGLLALLGAGLLIWGPFSSSFSSMDGGINGTKITCPMHVRTCQQPLLQPGCVQSIALPS